MNTSSSTTTTSRRPLVRGLVACLLGVAVLAGCNAPTSSSGPTGPVIDEPTPERDGGSRTDTDEQGSNEDAASSVEIDVQDVLDRVESMTTGTNSQASSLEEFMKFVIQDAANVWTWYYEQWGEGYPEVSQVSWVFLDEGQTADSKCVDAKGEAAVANDSSMFYCSSDDTIYFGFTAARQLWNGSMTGSLGLQAPGGDYALAAVIAHEYGHNVQAEMGVSRKDVGGPGHEQMADCLSGVFTQIAASQGILEEGDLEEGWQAIEMFGDDGTGVDPHGSPEDRLEAFWTGWTSTSPAACWSLAGIG